MNVDTEPLKELIPPPQPESKQKCQLCEALIARLFIDLDGKRIYLCQQDANTLLRLSCKIETSAMKTTYKFVEENVYGKEQEC